MVPRKPNAAFSINLERITAATMTGQKKITLHCHR